MPSTYMASLNHKRLSSSTQNHLITWVRKSYEKRLCKYYQPLRLEKPSNFRLVGWDARVVDLIWGRRKQQNFCLWDSTAQITPNLARRAGDFFTRRHPPSRRHRKIRHDGHALVSH